MAAQPQISYRKLAKRSELSSRSSQWFAMEVYVPRRLPYRVTSPTLPLCDDSWHSNIAASSRRDAQAGDLQLVEQERGCSAWDPGARGVCPLRGTLSPLQLFVSRRSFRSSFFSFKPAVKIRAVMSRQMKARNSHCHLYESWPQSSVTGVTAVQLGGRFARMEIRGKLQGHSHSAPLQLCWVTQSERIHFHFQACLPGLEGEQKFHFPEVITLYAGKYDTLFFRKSWWIPQILWKS